VAERRSLPFDPIDEAARQWGLRWSGVPQMHAVTSLMRVQQLVINRLDEILKPHGLTFARSRRSTMDVTEVGCTWSRWPILPSGSAPAREKVSRTSAS